MLTAEGRDLPRGVQSQQFRYERHLPVRRGAVLGPPGNNRPCSATAGADARASLARLPRLRPLTDHWSTASRSSTLTLGSRPAEYARLGMADLRRLHRCSPTSTLLGRAALTSILLGLARRRSKYVLTLLAISLAVGVVLYSLGELVFWRILAYVAIFHFVRQQLRLRHGLPASDGRTLAVGPLARQGGHLCNHALRRSASV